MGIAVLVPFVLMMRVVAAPAPEPIRGDEPDSDAWVTKSFVILKSTSSYRDARSFADVAARDLNVKLDLRGLARSSKLGLTFSRSQCIGDFGEFPCYAPRGRFDDGVYVSVEYSTGYKGFKKGLYIVVLANGSTGADEVRNALQKAKAKYADAYVKDTAVYLGCVH